LLAVFAEAFFFFVIAGFAATLLASAARALSLARNASIASLSGSCSEEAFREAIE
jgi:hypothetical protein